MTRILCSTILFLLLICLFGCQESEPITQEPEPKTPFRPESITETFDHPDCEIDGEPCVHLYFHQPRFRNPSPLGDSLRVWTERHLYYPEPGSTPTTPDKLAQDWFRDYDQFVSEIEDYRIPWSLERSVEKIFESQNLISLHFNEYSFTGGAHPHQMDVFQSFIRPEGKKLTLSDLTYDFDSFEQLVDLAEEQFRFSFELLENENLQEAGFHFVDGEFHLTENFAFTDFGLIFYFNTYEVAPYVTGPIAIELPYEDLRHLIRSRWLHEQNPRAL
ncbi:MAG: DUF3298 domain-containing protein [Balneolaceae bacterium]